MHTSDTLSVQPILALVDDDAALLHALSFSFEVHGFRVAAFANAEVALAGANMAAWRCMVLDYKLPGMSGLDLMGRLRARGVSAPAILITSNPSLATRARALLQGAEIVEKPLLDDELAVKVSRLWDAGV